jgi:aliphatic nitrilase
MPARFKATVVQAAPEFLRLDDCVDKAIGLMDQAHASGARLIAFPETWFPGYPWWIWLDSPAAGMPFVARYHANSLQADSPQARALQAAAKRNGLFVMTGQSERIGSSLYMGQWLIGDNGDLLMRRRKLKPTHVERAIFGEGDGSDLVVTDTALGRMGALCCWEHLQPLTKYAMYGMQEQIHIGGWPSFSVYPGAAYALGPEVNTAASRIYAVEGQCFVLGPCATVSPAMLEELADTETKRQLLQAGGGYAVAFAPDGRPLGEPLAPDAEGLLLAEIDLDQITLAKSVADPVGHYSRPDVTRLLLNRRSAKPVETMPAEEPVDDLPEADGSGPPIGPAVTGTD